MDRLYLCQGMRVSNAPAVTGRSAVADFTPLIAIRAVRLLRAPVDACMSSGFGPRRGGAGSFHYGLDLFTGRPRAVGAGGDGVVAFAGSQRGYGRVVIVDHGDGVTTRYAHLSSLAPRLRRGDRLRQGEVLGATGDSGNATAIHLHYEIRVDGVAIDPLAAQR